MTNPSEPSIDGAHSDRENALMEKLNTRTLALAMVSLLAALELLIIARLAT